MSGQDFSSDDSVPLEIVVEIDRLCEEFERAWRAGEHPRIEEYVERVATPFREHARRELIEQELDLKREKDQPTISLSDEAPPESEAMPAQMGRFRIDRVLGEGGFGVVYLAHDPELGRQVAIKVPKFTSPSEITQFMSEARVAAQLEHPGIVAVHDVQRDGDEVYIVQQYVAGQSLAERIRKTAFTPPDVARLLVAVCDAVACAHEAGLVHRDLKPQNILLDAEGRPRVADFGLAVHESAQQRLRGDRSGTAAFMSPEQVRGATHRLDGRSDIWSLGVILYLMLTRRRPFSGDKREAVFDEILHRDPKPPRQIKPELPAELERICLKCLCKRVTDRYNTALDLARDLGQYLEVAAQEDAITPVAPPKVVPKGLRAFGATDADFFLSLLPGPRDSHGIPDNLRFWISRIEETDPDKTFAVGLIYGPSGCGKSSFVRAGLLPRLAPHVASIYVEASPADTEVRLLKAIRKSCPKIPADITLPAVFDGLREGLWNTKGKKLLIVLDQFEQWLHARDLKTGSQLLEALRHCTGSGPQCLVLVRDDFWMSITRVMNQLDERLVEGENSTSIDLFDQAHAGSVLLEFGKAYEQLPFGELSQDQESFLELAVDSLASDGKIIPVRLAVFAELLKDKPWTTDTFNQLGGFQGVGVAFLVNTFHATNSPPTHRVHEKAAKAVLETLLPEVGTNIRGELRSIQELRIASGYDDRPKDFEALVDILDREVRLITPTDPDVGDPAATEASGEAHQYYQLTHDYLVQPLRNWLKRGQQETRQGRARLRLAERTAIWNGKPENRHLPSLPEWAGIHLLTNRRSWREPQQRMMVQADSYYLRRTVAYGGLFLLLLVLIAGGYYLAVDKYRSVEAQSLVQKIITAPTPNEFFEAMRDMQPYRQWADPLLEEHAQTATDRHDQLKCQVALSPRQPARIVPLLVDYLSQASQEEVTLIHWALRSQQEEVIPGLWTRVLASAVEPGHRGLLPTAAVLAAYTPADPLWPQASPAIAEALVSSDSSQLGGWMKLLEPIKTELLDALSRIYHEGEDDRAHRNATTILNHYASDNTELLVQLLMNSKGEGFQPLLASLASCDDATEELLRQLDQQGFENDRDDKTPNAAPAQVDQALERELADAGGMVTTAFAMAATLAVEDLDRVSQALAKHDYHPVRVRPYDANDAVQVAALWTRDAPLAQWKIGLTADEVTSTNAKWEQDGFVLADVSGYVVRSEVGERVDRYAALWIRPQTVPAAVEKLMGCGRKQLKQIASVPIQGAVYASEESPEEGVVPQAFQVWRSADGTYRYCAVAWRAAVGDQTTMGRHHPALITLDGEDVHDMTAWDVAVRRITRATADDIVDFDPDIPYLENFAAFQRARADYWLGNFPRALEQLRAISTTATPQASQWIQYPAPNKGSVDFDHSISHSGSYSVKLEPGTAGYIRAEQDVDVEPHTYYLLSGWVRTNALRIIREDRFVAAHLGSRDMDVSSASVTSAKNWQYLATIFNSRNLPEVRIHVGVGEKDSDCEGAAWFDDLCMVRLSADDLTDRDLRTPKFLTPERRQRNLLANTSFELPVDELTFWLGRCQALEGGSETLAKSVAALRETADSTCQLAHLEALQSVLGGDVEQALAVIEAVAARPPRDGYHALAAARILADLARLLRHRGNDEASHSAIRRALGYLEQAVADGFPEQSVMRNDPELALVREDPGFAHLREQIQQVSVPTGLWLDSPAVASECLLELTPGLHMARAESLYRKGLRPVSLSATSDTDSGDPQISSTWHKSVAPGTEREAAANRRAKLLLALLKLGHSASVLPYLRHGPEPDTRNFVIEGVGRAEVDLLLLAALLEDVTVDTTVRRAIILSLGDYGTAIRRSPAPGSSVIEKLFSLYRIDPDPGIHGAAEWLLRHWERNAPGEVHTGHAARLRQIDTEMAGLPHGDRGWWVNDQGHTFAVLGPVDVRLGSLPNVVRSDVELLHTQRIPRRFAVCTKEVTNTQFAKFLNSVPEWPRDPGWDRLSQTFSEAADGPRLMVSWMDAAAYCRWLSEMEGLSATEMCYPEYQRIDGNLVPPPDYLGRTGYRLLTEAEWEYACRAKTTTSRFCGDSEALLPSFAQYAANSGGVAAPVAFHKPNDFGMFAILGNAWEWCQDSWRPYHYDIRGVTAFDLEDPRELGHRRVLRGGSFEHGAAIVLRAAQRSFEDPVHRYHTYGFRIGRTMP